MTVEDLVSTYRQSPRVPSLYTFLERALSEAPASGLVLEFGVHTGDTIKTLALATARTVHGFDSFLGLPEQWNESNPAGAFNMAGVPPTGLPGNVTLVPGWFADTLPGFLERTPGRVALLHIDCDLYSSTKTVLDALAPRIVDGTVIAFNEFWDYPEAAEHEAKAFSEFLTATGLRAEALGRCGTAYCAASFRIRG